MIDKLIIQGVDGLDGEYPCNLVDMVTIGTAEALTNREGHRIKEMTGLRAGELADAFNADDSDVPLALAAVVLTRAGKVFDLDQLWDAQIGKIKFDLGERTEEADAGPPEVKPDAEPKPLLVVAETNGGESSRSSAEPRLASGPKPTGIPV